MEVEVPEVREIRARIKLKVNNFMDNNNDDDLFGYIELIKFTTDHHIIISSSVDDYINGNRPLKRKIVVYFYIVVGWIMLLRYVTLATIYKPWMWRLLGDPAYLLRRDNLMYMYAICISLLGLTVRQIILYYDHKMGLTFLPFLKEIMDNTTEYKLEHRNYLRFCKRSKFLIKLSVGLIYRALVSTFLACMVFLSIKAYMDPDVDFSITSLFLGFVLFYIAIRHYLATLIAGFIYVAISSLYLKYGFRQIKVKIQECIESGISHPVIDAIHEHNYCTESIQNLNIAFSKALFAVYLFSTPTVDILIHFTFEKNTNEILRMIYIIGIIQLILFLYIYNYIMSSLSSAAHDYTSDLHSFIVRNRSNPRNKLKISAFIEKLCGSTIGIYCFDWFAMTAFEFYKYIAFISSTYILMDGLLFNT